MTKRGNRPAADGASWVGRGGWAKRCTWPVVAAGAVALGIILEVLLSAPADPIRRSLCQDESGYVAHWKTDATDSKGRPLAEHDFDCAEIGRNTVSRRNTRKRVNVDGKKFETYISNVDCNNAEVAAKCRRTCGLCPDQAGEVRTSTHGHHRMLSQAEADIFHNAFKDEQQLELQAIVKERVGVSGPHHPSCLTQEINLLEVGKIDPCGYGGELARRQAAKLVAIYLEGCLPDALCCGTYRQQPGYGPGLFPHYKNAHGWWLFHDKREHRWMISNNYEAVERHVEEISSLADGAKADAAIVPSVKAHAYMTSAGVQPGGQRWLWKMPMSSDAFRLWEEDREAWVTSKRWEEVVVESITLTASLLTTEEEVARFEEYAEEGLEMQLEAGDATASALSSGVADPQNVANSGCVSDPEEGIWCFQIPADIAEVPVNQMKLVLHSGEEQEFFVTMDNDGALTQIPSNWAHRVVRVSMSIDTQELASVGLLVCGETAQQCYGRLITGENGSRPQIVKKVVKEWSDIEGLVEGEPRGNDLGPEGGWIRLWNGLDEEGRPLPPPPKPKAEGSQQDKKGAKKGHRLQLTGDVITRG